MISLINTNKSQILSVFKEMLKRTFSGLKSAYHFYSKFPKAYTCLIYLFISMSFCYYPIFNHWLAGFIMMTLPIAIILGLVASSYLLYKKQKMLAAIGAVWVLLSFPIIKRIVGIGHEVINPIATNSLKVLSFNSESFSRNDNHNLSALQADIACFQEYSQNQQIEDQYANKFVKLTSFSADRAVGLAIFTQYPIIKQYGKIWNREDKAPNINGFLCADVVYGNDTVRIVNTHLWSMGVRVNKAFDAFKQGEIRKFFFEVADTVKRLKNGFNARDEQVAEVESYVTGSKYPVIICGDFNEIPFSYTYGKLSLNFENAFEEVGQGLGFTLNRHPYCVRIDQQFFSSDWQVQSCKIIPSVTFSDHFPVVAQYILKKPNLLPIDFVAHR